MKIHWLAVIALGVAPGSLAAQDEISPVPVTRPAPTAPRLTPAAGVRQPRADSLEAVLRARIDSLLLASVTVSPKVPADSASRARFEGAVGTAKLILWIWFGLVLLYLVWAIHRYVYNYGLSNLEWKILYPEIYETWFDRWWHRRLEARWKTRSDAGRANGEPRPKSLAERRAALLEHRWRMQERTASSNGASLPQSPAADITQPFEEPDKNPYEQDSFGLPKGTIRGILALTALVMFLLVEGVNLAAPGNLEGHFRELTTAFEMVLAFYFGSRAVEVLNAKSDQAAREAESTSAAVRAIAARPAPQTGAAAAAQSEAAAKTISVAPVEKTFLPEDSAQKRFANVAAMARDGKAVAAPAAGKLTAQEPLIKRVLALTAAFETGRGFPGCFGTIAGNFDKQGISFGALQWNIGQGSVQPLWREMRDRHGAQLKACLGPLTDEFLGMLSGTKEEQMQWALGIQHLVSDRTNAWRFADNWRAALQALGQSDEMIAIQVNRADALFQTARGFCQEYGLKSDRGVALMFDIRVQNGSVDRKGSGDLIRADFDQLDPSLPQDEQEVARMRIIARRRSDVALPQWRQDVFLRKLTIAQGHGTVHGRRFDLEKDFGIGLGP